MLIQCTLKGTTFEAARSTIKGEHLGNIAIVCTTLTCLQCSRGPRELWLHCIMSSNAAINADIYSATQK